MPVAIPAGISPDRTADSEAVHLKIPGDTDGRDHGQSRDRRAPGQAASRSLQLPDPDGSGPEISAIQTQTLARSVRGTTMTSAPRVIALDTYDIRFPTSRELDGSDAMNPDPDYSAAYLVLRTDGGDGLEGHGFTFTIGRGNDVQVAAINALRDHVVGRDVDAALRGSRRRSTAP